ncbi:restriction endonuclease subunit S [Rhodococcus pyridinivorans]|nr:restriction endonuclease subunit S [Rhodococcus pyridinivorans]
MSPQGWRSVCLGELASIVTGATPKAAEADSWGEYLDFVTPSDQLEGHREAVPVRRLSKIGAERLKRRIVPPLSTNLTCIGSTIGKVSMAATECVTNQQINSLVAREQVADPRFIYYMILGWSPELKRFAAGSATPIVNKSDLSEFRFSVPNLPVQRAIAEVLGALDDKIAANRRLVETADELAVSIVRSGYVDGGEVQLGNIATITMGSSPPGDSYNEEGRGTVFYQGNRDFGFRSPTNRVWTLDPKRVAHAGDTLVSVRAPVGELNIATEETCVGRGLAALRSTEGAPAVLYYRLKAAPRVWDSYESGGTVFGSINGKELHALKIPALADVRLLEMSVSELDRIIASAEMESIQLAKIRDTLLPRLMSGELRVRDAEKITSNAI